MRKVKISKASFEVSRTTGRYGERNEDYGEFGGINPGHKIYWVDDCLKRHEVFSYGFNGESYYVELREISSYDYFIVEVEKNDILEIEE